MEYYKNANNELFGFEEDATLPIGLTEITLAEVKAINLDKNKLPVADRRDVAKKSIDQAAGSARSRYVSRGEFIGEEYNLALRQCQEWRLAGSLALAVPLSISDWAIASGMTDEQAAVDIEQTAQYFETTLLTIRQIRLSGKAAVDAAVDLGTHGDMSDVAQLYIDQLNAMP